MSEYLYFYRMTDDSGNAPCVFENGYRKSDTLSLACCKGGQVRNGKPIFTGLRHEIGMNYDTEKDAVYLVGIYKNCVLYACRITKTLSLKDYFGKGGEFSNRQDCIYEYLGENGAIEQNFRRRRGFNEFFHPNDDGNSRLIHDISGGYALLSNDFYYAGNKYAENPVPDTFMEFIPKNREKKKYERNGNTQLFGYIEKIMNKKSNFCPIYKLATKCKAGCQK